MLEENYLGSDFDPEQRFLVATSSATSSLPPSWSLSRSSLPSSLSWPCGPLYEHLLTDLRKPCIGVRNIATIPRKKIDTTSREVCCEPLAGGSQCRVPLFEGYHFGTPRVCQRRALLNERSHGTSSNRPFGRHPTGSAIQRLMSRFMPAGPAGADFELGRERALGNFAVDGGPGQPGPSEDGLQADDTVWFAHGRAASC